MCLLRNVSGSGWTLAALGCLLMMLIAIPLAGIAEQIPQVEQSEAQPVVINSNNMEMLSQEGKVLFEGNVKAVQGTFVMYSKSLEAEYEPQTHVMKIIHARGNVRFKDGNRNGTSEFASYAIPSSTLTMWGKPVVRDGENILAGSHIEYSTLTGRLAVKNAKTQFYRDQITAMSDK